MSVTGPGCAHCDRGRVTTPDGDVRPCDRCGGWSQFARLHNEALAEMRQPVADALAATYQPVVDEIAARLGMPAPRVSFDAPDIGAAVAAWGSQTPVALSPETDWRPLPSCAEVLAHSARTGGEAFAPWLRLPAGDSAVACVVMLAALDRESTPGVTAKVVVELLRGERLPYPGDTYRPITRRGEALPWTEVQR